jgi:hypothetical protein
MNDLQVVEERSVSEVMDQVYKIQDLMKDCLKDGTHYGESFPGDTKKNLLLPGADKINFMFRLMADPEVERIDLPNGHREYLTTCRLKSMGTGAVVAVGFGSCSTMESKYRWRNARRKCPACGAEAIIQGKAEYGGGWLCFAKKGGCGAKYDEADQAITGQVVGKEENPDIADVYNTVLKISNKRAYVAATIKASAVSDIFTQDAEEESHGDEPPSGKKPAATPPKKEGAPPSAPDFETRMRAAKELAKSYIAATYKNTLIFSADEIDLAKKKLVNLDMEGKSILLNKKNAEYLESIRDEYKKIMDKRVDQWKAEDDAMDDAELDEAADGAFVDDPLPADKKTKGMPGPEGSGLF